MAKKQPAALKRYNALKKRAKRLGLSTSGTMAQLAARVQAAVKRRSSHKTTTKKTTAKRKTARKSAAKKTTAKRKAARKSTAKKTTAKRKTRRFEFFPGLGI